MLRFAQHDGVCGPTIIPGGEALLFEPARFGFRETHFPSNNAANLSSNRRFFSRPARKIIRTGAQRATYA
jgi:hypothetical protein